MRTVGMAVAVPYGALVALHIARGHRVTEALMMPINDVQMAVSNMRQPGEVWRHLNRTNGKDGFKNAMSGIEETASQMKDSAGDIVDDMKTRASDMASDAKSRMDDEMKLGDEQRPTTGI
jgi:hypothetical protein